jgi:hypothetical protein
MKHIYYNINWLFKDYKKTSEEVIGDSKLYAPNTPKIYEAWIKECTLEKHASIIAALNKFIDSGDFRLGDEHFIDNGGSVRAEVAR